MRRTAGAVLGAVVAVAAACGSSGGETTTGPAATIDVATAEAAVAAGEVTVDDVDEASRGESDIDGWSEAARPDGEEAAACSIAALGAGEPLASGGSEVLVSGDGRGPTSVHVTLRSETVAYATTEEAATAFAALDADAFASCLGEFPGGDPEEGGAPLDASDIEVEEVDAPDAGDDARSLLATYDIDWGDGDDNIDAAEAVVVQVGPVVQVLWTTRSGEGHDDDVVEGPTVGLDDVATDLAGRVGDALAG